MKQNYQILMDDIIKNMPCRKKLLLHACCAPCATYCTEYLIPYFDITLLYYNPNTHPYEEYLKRLNALKTLSEITGIPVLEANYDDSLFFESVKGYEKEPEGGLRCSICFKLRLEETAKKASELGFDMFATTLTVSPHKNAELINEIGKKEGIKYGIEYLPSDFKKKNGFKRSTELSREYDLYRQNYCGCVYSTL